MCEQPISSNPLAPKQKFQTCLHSPSPNPFFAPVSQACDAHQDTARALRTVVNHLDMGVPRIQSGVCGSSLEARIKVHKSSTMSWKELSRGVKSLKSSPSYSMDPSCANCWNFGASWRSINPNISIGSVNGEIG